MAEATLKLLDAWYNEASQGGERPKLLSKLAAIELCGWIEGELDNIVLRTEAGRLNDAPWARKHILERNHGFTYSEHFRSMLIQLVGEVYARRAETRMENDHPGELDQLRSILGSLWKVRCSFAHADMAANVAAQQNFYAPSWFLNQHRLVAKYLPHLEASIHAVL